jgi:putative CRISPR-associated protein (TIGR02619 family)
MAVGRYILSSCGISVLTNGADRELVGLLNRHANDSEEELATLAGPEGDRIRQHLKEVEEGFFGADVATACKLSAEINGLLSLYGAGWEDARRERRDHLVLLHTDTALGARSCRMVAGWLESYGMAPQVVPVTSLNTRSRDDFLWGVNSLVEWLEDQDLPSWSERGYQLLFNLVGGFKAFQSYLTVLGMVYGAEVVYRFESSEELLRIPALPGLATGIMAVTEEEVRRHFTLFRRLHLGLPVPADGPNPVSEVLLWCDDHHWRLSLWGEVAWHRLEPKLYRERLWESPDPRVRFTEGFRAPSEAYRGQDEMLALNRHLDDLLRYLEGRGRRGSAPIPERLGLKPLRHHRGASDHEFYAWSHKDARRVYFHFENGVAVLDELGKHL